MAIFGTASAPYLATQTIKERACEVLDKWPEAARIILHDTYMDDSCSGAWNVTKATQIQGELKKLL